MSANTKKQNLRSWTANKLNELTGLSAPDQKSIGYLLTLANKSLSGPKGQSDYEKYLNEFIVPICQDKPALKRFKEDLIIRVKTAHLQSSSGAKKRDKKTDKAQLKYDALQALDSNMPLPGRKLCDCQAQVHDLINNCSRCGKIVCTQEGAGPCLYCGEFVASKNQMEYFASGTNRAKQDEARYRSGKMLDKTPVEWTEYYGMNIFMRDAENSENPSGEKINSDKFTKNALKTPTTPDVAAVMSSALEKLSFLPQEESLNKAELHKNKLLEYDATHAKRTAVIDSQQDYYKTSSSMFLSNTERKIAKKMADEEFKEKHKSRIDRKITIDFLGQGVIDEEDEHNKIKALEMQMDEEMKAENDKRKAAIAKEAENNPLLALKTIAPKYISKGKLKDLKNKNTEKTADTSRLQDAGFQEFIKSDTGRCLAMHQPWAGLLIKGIKIHEGRTWYSGHRGPLWISSAKHEMEPDQWSFILDKYAGEYKHALEPQSEWPISVLLGKVDVVDCLSQEEYREVFPGGSSEAPYVLICEAPEELEFKIPMVNDHKIFNMDGEVLRSARRQLQEQAFK